MTTYTFQQDPSNRFVDWNDPTVWTGGQVPNSADADVLFPLVIMGGSAYAAFVTIESSETFITRSVNELGDDLMIDGSLAVSGNLNLGPSAEITLEGALSFGSLTSGDSNGDYNIQGAGELTSPNSLTVTGAVIGAETVIVPTLFNTGLLEALEGPTALTIDLTDYTEPSSFSGGILAGGTYEAFQNGVLDLNVGAVITEISGTATIIGATTTVNAIPTPVPGTEINSYDPTTQSYRPFQDTVTTIDTSGVLDLEQVDYAASVPLTIAGNVELGGYFTALSSPDLRVVAGGTISGFGNVVGDFVNNGLIESGLPLINGQSRGLENLIIQGSVSGTGSLTVGTESSLELEGTVAQNVTFSDNTGRLYLDAPDQFTGSLTPNTSPSLAYYFGKDTIVISGINYDSVTSYDYSGDSSGGVLTIQVGESQEALTFVGSFDTADFTLSEGPEPITLTNGPPPPSPPTLEVSIACFCPGTLILTGEGETPVEHLAAGQAVVTASGDRRPIRWIGRRSYAGRFLAANPAVHPVRIRAGALGGGLPRRDLLLSPDHAIFLDGLLIPARCLVNDATILRERRLDEVDYYHIELDSHDVLLAEGTPSESFADDDSRDMFQNAAEWRQHHPGRQIEPVVFCAPRADSGPALDAIRRRLQGAAAGVVCAA